MATSFDIYAARGATLIVTQQAGECSQCHIAHFNFINRNGRTMCLNCDLHASATAQVRS